MIASLQALENVILGVMQFADAGLLNDAVSAVDVAEYAVQLLELEPLFNAGRGAVFTTDASHEMEACIMNGADMKSGAVSLLSSFQHPISAARLVMDRTPHRMLVGDGAAQLARCYGLKEQPQSFFFNQRRFDQLQMAKMAAAVSNANGGSNSSNADSNLVFNDHDLVRPHDASSQCGSSGGSADERGDSMGCGDGAVGAEHATGTVGCVCYFKGDVAAATSTGGMTNKMSGRIGDTPLLGSGTYASNDTCAVSCTGRGEEFMRAVAAYDIAARVKYGGMCLQQAVHHSLHGNDIINSDSSRNSISDSNSSGNYDCSSSARRSLADGSGGFICVDARSGDLVLDFNSLGMMRGWCRRVGAPSTPADAAANEWTGRAEVGIWEESLCIYSNC